MTHPVNRTLNRSARAAGSCLLLALAACVPGGGHRPPQGQASQATAGYTATGSYTAIASIAHADAKGAMAAANTGYAAPGTGGNLLKDQNGPNKSVADFRADQKWQDYRAHCDRLYFATSTEVPVVVPLHAPPQLVKV